jgi:Tol biopolymer transport system component
MRVCSALLASLAAVAALGLGCTDSGAERAATAAGTATSTAASGATLTPSASPPVPIATVTVQVPEGPPTERLLLLEGPALVLQERGGERSELARIDLASGVAAFPAWSPDGASIAFVRRTFFSGDPEADWGDDVFVLPADGGEARLVRAHTEKGEQVFGLAWMPDSERLLLGRVDVGLRNGIPYGIEGTAIVELDLETGAERAIIEDGYDPSVSADGARIAFTRLGEILGESSVVVADLDGSNATTVASTNSFEVLRLPRIAPDGGSVVFTAAVPFEFSSNRPSDRPGPDWLAALLGPLWPRPAAAHGVPMDLWLADVDTGAVERLTAIGEDDPYPAWSADGETIVFIGTNGTYEVEADGSGLIRIGEGRFDGQLAVDPR